MQLNHEQVKQFLPHRDPFLFVDSVSQVVLSEEANGKDDLVMRDLVGSQVKAHYHVNSEHPIFEGHFPGDPILPGVVQVEMMAQVSSFGVLKIFPDATERRVLMALLSILEAKFRKPVLPGMDLVIETTCLKMRGDFMTSEGKIFCGNELMSQASVLASVKLQ